MARTEKSKSKKVSVWNWMGTLILCSIPGVNIIALFLFIILAKAPAKRNFAIAALVLMVLAFILIFAAFLVFPDQLARIAAQLRGGTPGLVSPAL